MQLFIVFCGLLLITLVFFLILSKEKKDKIELFHAMTHKFRSPITIIRWYIELLSDKSIGDLSDKQNEYFAEIHKASEQLSENIDSLTILTQLQSPRPTIKKEKVDVENLVDQITQRFQFRIEKYKLHLRKIYPKDQKIVIQTDPRLLRVVLQNLIENAIKYTPENGNIDIKVDFLNKNLLIEIKDNGYGIPKDKRPKILTNSANSKDVIFNLYLVKLILKKMHAKINFRSEENKGTTFSIFLPADI